MSGKIPRRYVASVKDKEGREAELRRIRAAYKRGEYVEQKKYPEVPKKHD